MTDSVNAHIDEIIAENKRKPFFEDESAAAAPREILTIEKSRDLHKSNKVSNLIVESQQRITKDNERQRKWFDSGVRAKQHGYGDFSPFYENKTADYFFKCGYAGTSFAEAQEALTEKIKEFLETSPEVKEVLNELQPQKS